MARPSRNPELVPPKGSASIPAAGRAEAARIWVLGANLWTVACLMPGLIAGQLAVAGGSAALLALVALGVRSRPRRVLSATLLLALFPAGVLALVLTLDRLTGGGAHPPLALALAAASLLAYGAVTAQALARPAAREDIRHREMTTLLGDPAARGRRWRRRSLLTVATLGAVALAVVAPFVGGELALARAWGDSATAAGTLTAVVGGALGVVVLAAFIGPGLRRQRPPPASRRRWRVVMFLVVAATGGVVHTLLTQGT